MAGRGRPSARTDSTEAQSGGTAAADARRRIERAPTLPGSRALLGGLLVTTAAVGVFAASASSGDDDGSPIVVAATDLRAGEVIERDDLSVARGTLPTGAAGFASVDDVIGRAALGPMARGELIQTGSVTPDRSLGASRREVALTLPREQLAVGRLRAGDRVDVFVTQEDRTAVVVQGAEVLQLVASEEGSLTTSREVELVVAVESGDLVTALVHALRTGEITVVRSTFAQEQPAAAGDGVDPAGAGRRTGDETG